MDIHPDAMGALLVDPNVTEASIVECIKQGSGRHIVDYDEWARKVRVVVIHAAWRRHRRLCEAVKSLFTTAAFFVSSGGETSPLESGEPLYAVLESHQHPFCLRCITRMRPAGASAYVCPACGSIA
ncbi:MAG TPA: hypothetical protein VLE99_05440 [Candidatus Saccharimonadales bacterium]|nr:hypothetical protein [Candidatus Saccharimonadales bacterium]